MKKTINACIAAATILFAGAGRSYSQDAESWQLINIDMDGSIPAQKAVAAQITGRADLKDKENKLRLYANKKGLVSLRGAISRLREQYPDRWLTFVGSGDFHQTSAVLIESLPASCFPLTLVMIDNHPDWYRMPLHYHCATWVSTALRKPGLEKVILLGQDGDELRSRELLYAPLKDLYSGRVTIYPLQQENSILPLHWKSSIYGVKTCSKKLWGTAVSFETVRDLGVEKLAGRLAEQLAGKNVYISIDKDVLNKSCAITDWNQGDLSVDDLAVLVGKIGSTAHLVGADICGEQAPDALSGPWKRLDAARIKDSRAPDWNNVNEVNTRTNLRLIEAIAHRSPPAH